jgi:streptogramin lyase
LENDAFFIFVRKSSTRTASNAESQPLLEFGESPMTVRTLALFCLTVLLAACSGHTEQSPGVFLPQSTAAAPANATGSLEIRVRRAMHPDYISGSTKAMTVKLAGPTKLTKTVGLLQNATGCHSSLMTLQCTLNIPGLAACPSSKRCYTLSVATYDAFNAQSNRIPPGARVLSRDENLTFTIGKGTALIPLALQGVPASVAFVPAANTALTGSQSTGFVYPKCASAVQTAAILPVDADGNYIVGPGAPAITVASDDPAQLGIAKETTSGYVLKTPVAPAYAFGNHTTHVTITAKPGKASGATPRSTVVGITYSGTICGIVTEFAVPTAASEPSNIALGPNGSLWFAEFTGNKIGTITPAGAIAEFAVPTAAAGPFGIVSGPDGNLWFSETSASKIGKMSTLGSFDEFTTTTAAAQPYGITSGSDGNLWFTELATGAVARITTSGTVTEFSIGAATQPSGIASGADGNLWFSESNKGRIAQATPAGITTSFAIPSGATSSPTGIVTGADGDLWFAETARNYIGRIATTGTVLSQFPLPEPSSGPTFIIAGPDGNVWFTEEAGNRIGGITPAGVVTEIGVPTAGSEPVGIAVGPDGALWFTEFGGNKIGRLR